MGGDHYQYQSARDLLGRLVSGLYCCMEKETTEKQAQEMILILAVGGLLMNRNILTLLNIMKCSFPGAEQIP